MKLRHSARTDVGKTRDHNEDSYGLGEEQQAEQMGELLVVCDGMGGHAAGEVASKLAVETILASYYDDDSEDRPHVLMQAFEQANAKVYAHGRGSMGTTGVAALLLHDAVHIANVGDSRAYLIRDGEIRQVSRDHSFVGDQVAAGLITPDQARVSPHRNVITRALGYQAEVTVDLFRLPLQIGDRIVLSSDGMHGLVTDDEIREVVTTLPPDQAADRLIDLANSRGGTDNITVVVAEVMALDWYESGDVAADLSERVTVELPASDVEIVEAPAAAAPPPAPIVPEPPPAPAAASPAPPPSKERRFNWLGGLLALVLLAALLGIIAFALYPEPVLAPGNEATAAASPAPSAAATSAPTDLATAAPSAPAATQPAAQATAAQATAAPTTPATAGPTSRTTATP